jgi:hypothetical protein
LFFNDTSENGASEDIRIMPLKFHLDLMSRHMLHECLKQPKVLNRSTIPFIPFGAEVGLHKLSQDSPQAWELQGDT